MAAHKLAIRMRQTLARFLKLPKIGGMTPPMSHDVSLDSEERAAIRRELGGDGYPECIDEDFGYGHSSPGRSYRRSR